MHSIDATILTKEDADRANIPYAQLKVPSLVITTEDGVDAKVLAPLAEPKLPGSLVRVQTDYFGGAGEQSAQLYIITATSTQKIEHDTINDALAHAFGIKEVDGVDAFDQVGLGEFRTNNDIESACIKRMMEDDAPDLGPDEWDEVPVEAERRWIMKRFNYSSLGWTPQYITQLYLPSVEEITKRIREVRFMKGSKEAYLYILTEKKHISNGVVREREREIGRDEFYELAETATSYVNKIRYVVQTPDGLHWEIDDLYEVGLSFAEVELPVAAEEDIMSYPLEVADFVKSNSIREVTGDAAYSNKAVSTPMDDKMRLVLMQSKRNLRVNLEGTIANILKHEVPFISIDERKLREAAEDNPAVVTSTANFLRVDMALNID